MDGMCRTRFRLCALAVGLVVLALPARSRTAFAWAAGDGYYSLINRHSGSALDVIGASTESGAAVIQYLGHLNANQQWLLREVVATPQVTTADAIRFLEQATFGPTPELVAHVQSVGFEQFLDEQFDAPRLELSDAAAVSDDAGYRGVPERVRLSARQLHDVSAAEPLLHQRALRRRSAAPARRLRAAPDPRRLRTSTSRSQAG